MKTILAPTDFSQNALNAVQYAAALAEQARAKLVLLNHFVYPLPATDIPDVAPIYIDEVSRATERKLDELKAELSKKYNIQIENFARCASAVFDIEELAEEIDADLVVVGFRGQNPTVNMLFGSVSAALIRRGRVPVLVVPPGVVFRPVKTILFACDDHHLEKPQILTPLIELASMFNAYVEVATVHPDDGRETKSHHRQPLQSNLEKVLQHLRHGYTYEFGETIAEGILEEAMWSKADIVAMIPRHHSWFANVLGRSNTQQVATKIKIPLLVMSEKMDADEEVGEKVAAMA